MTSPVIWDFVNGVQSLGPYRYATEMHDDVARFAHDRGWRVFFEWPVPYVRTTGRAVRGRIDLLMVKDGVIVAVEMDNTHPRTRSVKKLLAVPDATFRLVILRGAQSPHWQGNVFVVGVRGNVPDPRASIRGGQ